MPEEVDYRAEALKVAAAQPQETEQQNTEQVDEDKVAEPQNDMDKVEAELAAKAKAEAQAAEKVTEPEKKEEPLKERFSSLVREKAQLRKREQQLAEMEKKFAPLAKAIEQGDVLGLVTAAGFNHQQYVSQMVEGKKASPVANTHSESESDLKAEVRQLREMLMQQQAQSFRANLATQVREKATKLEPKLPFVRAKGAEEEALSFLEQYYNEVGELPGKNIEESIEMALEAVEDRYQQQAKEWETLLTKAKKPAQTASASQSSREEAVEKPGSGPGRTLTNSMSAPAKKADEDDLSPEALRAKARAMLFNK